MRNRMYLLMLSAFSLGCHMSPKVPPLVEAAGRAVQAKPQDSGTWVEYGRASLFVNNSAAAEMAFRRAVRIDPKSLVAHKHLGLLLTDQQRHSEAREVYEHAVHLKDADSELWTSFGYCLAAAGEEAMAAEAFTKAATLNTSAVVLISAKLGLAGLLSRQGNEAGARAAYQEAVNLAPTVVTMVAEQSGRTQPPAPSPQPR